MLPWPPILDRLDPDERLDVIQAQIQARIKEFEPTALVDLLLALGYPLEQLEFRSNPSLAPLPWIVEDIEFPQRYGDLDDELRVMITVNVGLLSCRSPLPTYFSRLAQRGVEAYPIVELLNALDRSLLHTRMTCGRAERSVREWRDAQRNFLDCTNLNSVFGLQWLCQQVFPELGVLVRRTDNEREVDAIGARLDGLSKLGACSFGSRARVGVHELEVLLICEDSRYDEARPWLVVGKQRLRDHVFPYLDEVCVTLTVSFVLLDRGMRARLSQAPPSYVGYDPMLEDDAPPPDPPAQIRLYRGILPRAERDTDGLERVLAEDTGARLEIRAREPEPPRLAIGRSLALELVCVDRVGEEVYLVVVDWGARAWYRDEPFRVSVDFVDRWDLPGIVPKPGVSPVEHQRLWSLVRDAARERLGRAMSEVILDGGPVTKELVDGLMRRRDFEGLHALALAKVVPVQAWDADAWIAFSGHVNGSAGVDSL